MTLMLTLIHDNYLHVLTEFDVITHGIDIEKTYKSTSKWIPYVYINVFVLYVSVYQF